MLLCCSLFSYFHYGFSLYQIFQASREYYVILCYYFLVRLPLRQVSSILKILSCLTLCVSIIYIAQVLVVHAPLLPYENVDKIEVDETTGLIRLYNYPILLYFFLFVSFLYPSFYKQKAKYVRGVCLMALFCTLGRSGIASVVLLLIIGLLLSGRLTINLKTFCVICLFVLPFIGLVRDRFVSNGKTQSDFAFLFSGDLADMNMGDFTKEGATLTYRFAWVYERYVYLRQQNNGELLWGLGLISGNQPKALKMYDFKLGLTNKDTGYPHQLGTPDIAWGNILSRFGMIGIVFYIIFWGIIIRKMWKSRKEDPIVLCGMLYVMAYVMTSVAGSSISYTTFMAFPFLILSLIGTTQKTKYGES